MPNQQDFVLNMVAKLDEGSVQTDAAQMASQIARTIEQAFEGIGQKIADNILRGMQSGVQSASGLVDPSGRPISPGAPPPPPMQQIGAAPPGAFTSPITSTQAGFAHTPSYLDVNAQPSQIASMIRQQIQADIMGGGMPGAPGGRGGGPLTNFETNPAALQADVAYQRARQIQAMKRAGIDVSLSPEEQDQFQQARQTGIKSLEEGRSSSKQLADHIEQLNKSIVDLQKEMNESNNLSQEERAQRRIRDPEEIKAQQDVARAQLSRSQSELSQLTGAMGVESGRVSALSGVLPGSNRIGQLQGRAGIVGALLAAAGQMYPSMRRGEVGTAQFQNVQARAALGGDIESLMAIEQMGGAGALESGSTREALLQLGGNVGMAAGGGAIFGGGWGALAGGGLALTHGVLGFGGLQAQAQQSRIQAQISQNMEFFQATAGARGTALGAFRGAQGMGAPEMARLLAAQGSFGGVNLRSAAIGANLDEGMLGQTMQGLAGGLGGAFYGGAPALMGMGGDIQTVMQMRGAGLANATGLIGSMFQGAGPNAGAQAGRSAAITQVKEMFEDAVSAGLDKARVGQALQFVATQAQSGLGAAGAAQAAFRQDLGVAQRMFGGGGIEGAEMGFVQQAMGGIMQAGRGGGGIAGIGRRQAILDFVRRRSPNMSALQIENILQGRITPEGLQQRGLVGEGEDAQDVYNQLRQSILQRTGTVAEEAFGGMPGAREFALAGMTGADTDIERMAAAGIPGAVGAGARGNREAIAQLGLGKPFRVSQAAQDAQAQLGGDIARTMAEIDITKISGGFNTLGQQANNLAASLENAVNRINSVLQQQGLGPAATTVPTFENLMQTSSYKQSRNLRTKASPKK